MANGGRLSGEVAIVTAGGQGIGEAIAKTFAHEGATVAVVDINGETAERVSCEIAAAGGKAFALTVDVTKSDKVDAMVADVVKRCGTVDILVNGAGGWHKIVPLVDITDEEWDRLLTLNITTAFYCARAAARVMIEKKSGRIISIASNAGIAPSPLAKSCLPYVAGKSALIGISKFLANDLGPYGITVNCVAPGTTLTPRVKKARDQATIDRLIATNPLRRLVEAQDAADATLFLASKEARNITGVCLQVNAGKLIS
jgi:NAD(P)-dependent dehydrogenase (short-subunit alcohol dehydrogenase family)